MSVIGKMSVTPSIDEVFGSRVRKVRESKRLTQEQLAAEMRARGFDISQPTIYKLESGQRKVSIAEALALAEILIIDIENLAINESDKISIAQFEIRHLAAEVYDSVWEASKIETRTYHGNTELKLAIEKFEKQFGEEIEVNFNGVISTPRKYFERLIWFAENNNSNKGFLNDPADSHQDYVVGRYLGILVDEE